MGGVLRLIIPSAGYGDMLALTLPVWRRWLGVRAHIVVVTHDADELSREQGRLWADATVVTEAWWTHAAARCPLNKAAALTEACDFARHSGEVFLVTDADIAPAGQPPDVSKLRADALYGCARYECLDRESYEAAERAPLAWPIQPHHLRNQPRRWLTHEQAASSLFYGYFQLFKAHARLTYGSYPTAERYDMDFQKQFLRKVGITTCWMRHLGPNDTRNWKGRILPAWAGAQT